MNRHGTIRIAGFSYLVVAAFVLALGACAHAAPVPAPAPRPWDGRPRYLFCSTADTVAASPRRLFDSALASLRRLDARPFVASRDSGLIVVGGDGAPPGLGGNLPSGVRMYFRITLQPTHDEGQSVVGVLSGVSESPVALSTHQRTVVLWKQAHAFLVRWLSGSGITRVCP